MFFEDCTLMKQILDKPYLADKWIGFKRLLLLLLIIIPKTSTIITFNYYPYHCSYRFLSPL